jgi:hypothetical protein
LVRVLVVEEMGLFEVLMTVIRVSASGRVRAHILQ